MAPRSEKPLKHKNNAKPKIDKASKKITKPKSGDVVKKSESLAMQLEDEVPDFPRGGEFKVKRGRDDYDKFGDDDDSKKVWKTKKKGKIGDDDDSKKVKKSDEAESDWGLLSGAGITGKLPLYVNRVTLKRYEVGSLVEAEITEIKAFELKLKFGFGLHGRVHITEVHDADLPENPFSGYKIGQTVTARIVSVPYEKDSSRNGSRWELSVRPEMVTGSSDIQGNVSEKLDFKIGQCVAGYVYKVDKQWAWLAVSRNVNAQLHILDSSAEPNELEDFQNRYYVGKPVSGYVLSIKLQKKILRLVLKLPFRPNEEPQIDAVNKDLTAYIHEGDILGGKISKILPGVGGLLVQIGPCIYGNVHFTELTDKWVPDPLSEYHVGQFVKCVVLEVSNTFRGHVDLSLSSSNATANVHSNGHADDKYVKIEDLHPDMVVKGYVKTVSPNGWFIMLSRKIEARILKSNLSDQSVTDPVKEFPVGKLVTGRVVSVEPLSNLVEVTLKTSTDLGKFHVGDVISGSIKSVERYGLFIAIDNTNVVGWCHVSDISDKHIDNIVAEFRIGEKVNAIVLKVDEGSRIYYQVDEGSRKVSLGMKDSYMRGSDEPMQME